MRSSRHSGTIDRTSSERARMLVCPHDYHWCDVPGCRFAGCEMTAEPALRTCLECGAVVDRITVLGLCLGCAGDTGATPAAARGK